MPDVGKITRELQAQFALFGASRDGLVTNTKNRATPENLAVLLASLERTTDEIRERRRVVTWNDAADVLLDRQLEQWRGRLGAYQDAVKAAPAGDRAAVLWSVTAPLLLGFYGGEASELPQQPLDAITPFQLVNALDVAEQWREERWDLLLEDLKNNAKDLVDDASSVVTALVVGGVVVGGVVVVSWLRSMWK